MFGSGDKKFRSFGHAKAKLDKKASVCRWRLHDLRRTAVSGMARLGVPPHVADKILNHTAGTISGVAAVYQRHEFMAERKEALDAWARHLSAIVRTTTVEMRIEQRFPKPLVGGSSPPGTATLIESPFVLSYLEFPLANLNTWFAKGGSL